MANPPVLIEKIESHLRENLTPYRCEHVLSVRDQAVSLARQHGINEDQAELAALLHDCLKELSNNELLQYADEHGLEIDEHERKNLSLLHGKVAPYFARSEFGVEDEVVFDAMRKHTTGAVEMGPVDTLLFVADFLRTAPAVRRGSNRAHPCRARSRDCRARGCPMQDPQEPLQASRHSSRLIPCLQRHGGKTHRGSRG